jgi:hypothetical protein
VQDELAMKFLEGEFGDYDRILIGLSHGKLVFERKGRAGHEAAN